MDGIEKAQMTEVIHKTDSLDNTTKHLLTQIVNNTNESNESVLAVIQ
jgi:hypothetical protein